MNAICPSTLLCCAGKLIERLQTSVVLWKHGPGRQVCSRDSWVPFLIQFSTTTRRDVRCSQLFWPHHDL